MHIEYIELDPSVTPVHAPLRRVPAVKLDLVNEELKRFCEDADIDTYRNLVQLLEKYAEHDLRFSPKKCQSKPPFVTFVGHKPTHKGVELILPK